MGESLPGTRSRDNFLRNVTSQWFNSDPAAAVDWLKGLPDDASKNHVIDGVAFQWAQGDLPSAMAYLAPCPPARRRIT